MCVCVCVIYKVSENPADDLEYWLSAESSVTQPTATNIATLPGTNDSTKQQTGPESVDDSEILPASVSAIVMLCSDT